MPARHVLQSGAAHQAFHPTAADLQLLSKDKFGMDLAVAVGGGVDVPDRIRCAYSHAQSLARRVLHS